MQIYLAKPGGQKEGPFTLEEINRDLASSKYSYNDYWAWHEGLPQWMPLHSVPGVIAKPVAGAPEMGVPGSSRSAIPQKPGPPVAAKPRPTAGITSQPGKGSTPVKVGAPKPSKPPSKPAAPAKSVESRSVSSRTSEKAEKPPSPPKQTSAIPGQAKPEAPAVVKPKPSPSAAAPKPVVVKLPPKKSDIPGTSTLEPAKPVAPSKSTPGVVAKTTPAAPAQPSPQPAATPVTPQPTSDAATQSGARAPAQGMTKPSEPAKPEPDVPPGEDGPATSAAPSPKPTPTVAAPQPSAGVFAQTETVTEGDQSAPTEPTASDRQVPFVAAIPGPEGSTATAGSPGQLPETSLKAGPQLASQPAVDESPLLPTNSTEPALSETAAAAIQATEEPTAPKLEGPSGLPFSALEQIFVFTTGEGRTVFESAKLASIVQETVGEPLSAVRQKIPVDVVGNADVGVQLLIDSATPEKAWRAMNAINPAAATKAQEGLYELCVRPFSVETNDVVALFLFYDPSKV